MCYEHKNYQENIKECLILWVVNYYYLATTENKFCLNAIKIVYLIKIL